MDYELLKQLKDAGFRKDNELGWGQVGGQGRWLYGPKGVPDEEETVYDPIADELIEEMGNNFYRLYRSGADSWVATTCPVWYNEDTKEEGGFVETKGESVKEALVKLYIEVSKQK